MSIAGVKLERFTAFESLRVHFSPGLNVFVGANGTGKTHLLKLVYAACDITKSQIDFPEKLVRVFLPSGRALGRLVKRQKASTRCAVEVFRQDLKLRASFTNHAQKAASATVTGAGAWRATPVESVYIPVKEMLSSAPGFRSLYAQREIHFEEIYADILDRAYRPALRGPTPSARRRLLDYLQKIIEGRVVIKDEEFFLRSRQGNLEFSLLAEGLRKLALIWLLIQNGTLLEGSTLFWDEPETNLNPKLYGPLIDILLTLQRSGVQVFLATHDYLILKEIDLRREKDDQIRFFSLYRDSVSGEIACHASSDYNGIHPNAVADAFADVYDREVKRSLGGLEK
ncbi:MAG: AAA family ATPase [Desulfosoma sp.]